MATLKSPLLRKLKRILAERFPSPATVKVEDHNGIIGVITSDRFRGMDTVDRQHLIAEIMEEQLTTQERRQVQVIVAVTPEEGTGYLAAVD